MLVFLIALVTLLFCKKSYIVVVQAGEMVYWLIALVELSENSGSVLSTHMVAVVPQHQHPLLSSAGTRHACGAHTYIQAKNTYTSG